MYWIASGLSFTKWMNPIGEILCNDYTHPNVYSFLECSIQCSNYSMFGYRKDNRCLCLNDAKVEGFGHVIPCDGAICSSGDSRYIVYKYVERAEDMKCETVYYSSRTFGVTGCSSEQTDGYICDDGSVSQERNLSWYEALNRCGGSKGGLRQKQFDNISNVPVGTYWVSMFRAYRQTSRFSQNVTDRDMCVAATIRSDGKLLYTTRNCSEQLPSLCHAIIYREDGGDLMGKYVGIGVLLGSFCFVVCLVICLCKKRLRPQVSNQRRSDHSAVNQRTHEMDEFNKSGGTPPEPGNTNSYRYSLAIINDSDARQDQKNGCPCKESKYGTDQPEGIYDMPNFDKIPPGQHPNYGHTENSGENHYELFN